MLGSVWPEGNGTKEGAENGNAEIRISGRASDATFFAVPIPHFPRSAFPATAAEYRAQGLMISYSINLVWFLIYRCRPAFIRRFWPFLMKMNTNEHKLLTTNDLCANSSLQNQAQSSLIKPNQDIL